MKISNINCILFFLFLFINPVFAGLLGVCSPDKIQEELIQLNLDPEIKTNEQLLAALKTIYGNEIEEFLTKKHPYIAQAPLDTIDEQTLQWTAEAIWSPKNKIATHMLILMSLDNRSIFKDYVSTAFKRLLDLKNKTKLIFLNNEDFLFFKKHSTLMLEEILLDNNPLTPDAEKIHVIRKFKKYYFSKSGYNIGFDASINKKPLLVIDGHGDAGNDNLLIGDELFSVDQLVERLAALQIPSDSVIRLEVCFSGCTKRKLDLSVAEIKLAFKSGLLNQHAGPVHGSLMHTLSKKVYQEIPTFNGSFEGYIGSVNTISQKDVLKKDGTLMLRGNASKVEGTTGSILLKKEEVMVLISRSDHLS